VAGGELAARCGVVDLWPETGGTVGDPYIALWWLPVGAGGHFVVHTSRWWEETRAWKERRAARPLFHAALEIFTGQERYVVEMAPAWGRDSRSRNVVATGPVGLHWLGRFQLFRYEVRCWNGGDIPDRAFAPAQPTLISLTSAEVESLVWRVGEVPRYTWGRDPGKGGDPQRACTSGRACALGRVGDMWNSNSLISWLLETSGIDTAELVPPHGGSAPGWVAGVTVARFGLAHSA